MIDAVLKLFGVKPPPILDRIGKPNRRVACTGVFRTVIGESSGGDGPFDVIGYDATGIVTVGGLRSLYDFFHPRMRKVAPNARLLLLADEPSGSASPEAAAAARAVEGFVRTLAKEVGGKGATANLIYVTPGLMDPVAVLRGPIEFFCGATSAYVSGQVIHVGASVRPPEAVNMMGKVVLVTGASRGIGAAAAAQLVRQGAEVFALDIPALRAELDQTCRQIGARPLALDLAGEGAAAELARHFGAGIDIVVHNAGITRDRTLGKMDAADWDKVMAINLQAILSANEALDFRPGARIVCLSSTSGIAGNFGQANYASSKAALIGYVAAAAPVLAERGITINAVAPGFIETPMTRRMPLLPREVGRRVNSLKQAGQPEDVAALVAFLCTPGAYGISGNTIRVCGQSIMGA